VQRSPDGGEDRTIAKTVSLLLTPQQASKLTLAENLGQISLIPRNPDDDEASDVTEYSTGDLLGDAGRGSREKEQSRAEDDDSKGKDLLTAIQQHLPPPNPPFEMEIVEANDVRVLQFDADTGKPIRDASTSPSDSGSSTGSGPSTSPAAGKSSGQSDASEEDMLKKFPINFD
jgi:hypothetical protein